MKRLIIPFAVLGLITVVFFLSAPSETAAPGVLKTPSPPTATIRVGPTPTARIVMQATDPSTVTIAAGRPQIIEFFAYW